MRVWGSNDTLAQISPRDLEDKSKREQEKRGSVAGGGLILEMAFNMAQWPCRGIQYSR